MNKNVGQSWELSRVFTKVWKANSKTVEKNLIGCFEQFVEIVHAPFVVYSNIIRELCNNSFNF